MPSDTNFAQCSGSSATTTTTATASGISAGDVKQDVKQATPQTEDRKPLSMTAAIELIKKADDLNKFTDALDRSMRAPFYGDLEKWQRVLDQARKNYKARTANGDFERCDYLEELIQNEILKTDNAGEGPA